MTRYRQAKMTFTLEPASPPTGGSGVSRKTAGDVYREALEQVCKTNRAFAAFLKGRIELSYSNATAHEASSGQIAHRDRASAAELQYALQQFERMTQ